MILILTYCFTHLIMYSQEQYVVATAGDHFEKSTCSISWTLGECISGFVEKSTCSINQGFQQGNLVVQEVPNSVTNPSQLKMEVFPNPVSNFLTIQMDEFQTELSVTIFNLTGQQFNMQELSGITTTIDLSSLSAGPYLLKISNKDQTILETYKIIKF